MSYENLLRKERIRSLLANHKTKFDHLVRDTRDDVLINLINLTLQSKNAELKLNDNGDLELIRKDGTTVFGPDNRPWDPTILIRQSLIENKVLEEVLTTTNEKPVTNQITSIQPAAELTQKRSRNVLSNLVNQSLTDLEKSHETKIF